MASTALFEIEKAIFSTLDGDVTLGALINGVFNHVPDTRRYPFITMVSATEIRFNTFGRDGKEATVTLNIWSQYQGFKEAFEILDRMNFLLDGAAFAITNFALVYIQLDDTTVLQNEEDRLNQVSVRYRIIVQNA